MNGISILVYIVLCKLNGPIPSTVKLQNVTFYSWEQQLSSSAKIYAIIMKLISGFRGWAQFLVQFTRVCKSFCRNVISPSIYCCDQYKREHQETFFFITKYFRGQQQKIRISKFLE